MSDPIPSLAAFVPQDVRVVSVRAGLVPGYVTVRLEPRLPWTPGANGVNLPYALAACQIQIRNLSVYDATGAQSFVSDKKDVDTNDVVLQFQETDDDSPSGIRTKLAAVSVKAGGTASVALTPQRQYFEVKGIAGNGPVSLEIQSKIDWNERGFSQKLDPLFPSTEWAFQEQVSIVSSAAEVFALSALWTVAHNLGYVASPTLFSSAGVDITALAVISAETVNGYVATFGSGTPQAGTAYSTK
jgi:hypothetical protein